MLTPEKALAHSADEQSNGYCANSGAVRRLQCAEKVVSDLGLTPADAINILMAQIEIRQGLPFEVNPRPKPLLTAEEQGAAWTEAFVAY